MTRARIEIPIDLDDLPDRVVAIETSLAALHGKVDTLMGIAQDIRAAAQALKDGQAEAAAKADAVQAAVDALEAAIQNLATQAGVDSADLQAAFADLQSALAAQTTARDKVDAAIADAANPDDQQPPPPVTP